MTIPRWLSGPIDRLVVAPDAPTVWHGRIDDPRVIDEARHAPLRADDLRDLASRPRAELRAMRRQLTKLLLARAADVHPDTVRIVRSAIGAPLVEAPVGWYVSVAARWPHCVIGISREPLGVDIEVIATVPLPLDVFAMDEPASIPALSLTEQTTSWVAKEAHAKRYGCASNIDPAMINVALLSPDLALAQSSLAASICHIRVADRHVLGAAVCASRLSSTGSFLQQC